MILILIQNSKKLQAVNGLEILYHYNKLIVKMNLTE